MNWYKKLLASSNIPIPDKTKSEIMDICSSIIQNWSEFEKSGEEERKVSSISIYDPYYKINREADVFMAGRDKIYAGQNIIAGYDHDKKVINIFPENLVKGNVVLSLRDNNASHELYYFVIHEVEHIIDPDLNRKIEERNKNRDEEKDNQFWKNYWENYETGYIEFNAYCRQITEVILKKCKDNLSEIAGWLSRDSILPVPSCMNEFYGTIILWWKSKPILIRKLKQRIYNEIKNKLPKEEKK